MSVILLLRNLYIIFLPECQALNDARYKMQDSGSKMQDPRCKIQDARCRTGLVFGVLCIVDGWLKKKKSLIDADLQDRNPQMKSASVPLKTR